MQKGKFWEILLIIVVGVILVYGLLYAVPNAVKNNQPDIVIPPIVIPTAQEIAGEIEVPSLSSRNSNFNDILEGVYPDLVDDLLDDCSDDLWAEFKDDVLSDVEDTIEDEINEDIEDVSITDYNWDDQIDYRVIDLGVHDEDDRELEITSILRVRYHEEFGDSDFHFEKVESVARCSRWDNDDDEFRDLEVSYEVI